jgi:hypothetical protein
VVAITQVAARPALDEVRAGLIAGLKKRGYIDGTTVRRRRSRRPRWNRQEGPENQTLFGRMMKAQMKPFALCIDNADYQVSLIRGKVYRVLSDPKAAKDDLVRIVDESGEDYLYHRSHFVFVDFPPGVRKRILALEDAA